MRRAIVVALLAFAAGAHAENFRSHAPIRVEGADPFQRVQLPVEVYRDARSDLGDLRVVNARGEAVPLAFAGDAIPERETPQTVRLPQFAVTAPASAAATASGRIDIRVRALPNGTLVSVDQRPTGKTPAPGTRATSYILDASAFKPAVGAMIFDWDAKPGSEVVKVSVEASDDLREWRTVASRAALVRLAQGGQVLAQTRVALSSVNAKYYRVTWDGAALELRSVEAESAATTKPPEARKVTTVQGTRTKEGDIVYDMGARLPVEAVRVIFPEANSVAPFEIASRDGPPNAPWRSRYSGTFYRIVRDGAELVPSPVEIGVHPARAWRLHPQVKDGAADPLPSLEVSWRPADVVFVAKGEGPFSLAFGDPEARSVAIPIASLIPDYKRGAELRLPRASLDVVSSTPPPSASRTFFSDIEPRKAGLWAVLVLGVLTLGFMAWRLVGQMKAGQRPPTDGR